MTRCVRCSSEMTPLHVFCSHCQHPNEPDFKQLINQTIGNRFQLYRQLGEGGLSTIFAAIDLHTDKTVVVKVSDPRHLTQTSYNSAAERAEARQYWAEMTERMQREVAALTNVHHPNIVRVFAAGAISADLSYVVMELLRGKTLRDELNARGRLPINEAVAMAIEVAAGLSIIHPRGIVHRDLTPRNIFICDEIAEFGLRIADSFTANTSSTTKRNIVEQSAIRNPQSAIVKLIDFGIAKFPKQPGAQTYTQHAVMAGTPGYASPEQFQNLAVDHRADIYSLGVVLYEMLTGEKPFAGRSATEIAVKQLRDEPVRPRALVPEMPQRLEALILRALSKDPAVRQQSAAELIAELRAVSSRVEVPLFVPAATPIAFAPEIEPSGSQVFSVLSDLVTKDEPKPVESERIEEKAAVIPPAPMPEITFSYPNPRRHRAALIAACMVFLFAAAAWGFWLVNGRKPAPMQTALPTPSSTAIATPTLRPDVVAPQTNSRVTTARHQPADNNVVVEKVSAPAEAAVIPKPRPVPSIISAPVSTPKPPAPTPRPSATPTPAVIAARVPTPPIVTPSVKIEPTPSPAPPPIRDETARVPNNDGWRREPVRPTPTRSPEPVQPRPTATPAILEPRVISWQGRVNGTREVTLEMPGVPGMVDIPRDYRKKVGVVEPPSPSNGWRRAVLRVFGNGDVSLIIRWQPHRDTSLYKQEVVRWARNQ